MLISIMAVCAKMALLNLEPLRIQGKWHYDIFELDMVVRQVGFWGLGYGS